MSVHKDEDKMKPGDGKEKNEINEDKYYEDSTTKALHPNSIFRKEKTLGGG